MPVASSKRRQYHYDSDDYRTRHDAFVLNARILNQIVLRLVLN